MDETEIQTLLSRYTELEKLFLKYSLSFQVIGNTCPYIAQDFLDEKKMPVSKIDFKQFASSGRLMLDEKNYMLDGENIAFRVHPRFCSIPEHRHSFIEMLYVYSGSCVQWVNGIQIPMTEGDACILDTNVYHSFESVGKNDIILDCLMRKSYFDSTFISQLANNDLISSFFIHAISQDKNYNQYILFHAQKSRILRQMITNVLCEYFDKGICSDNLINSYMVIIFTELLRVYKLDMDMEEAALNSTGEADIGAIIRYIRKHCRTITLEATARKFNFHPSTLCTILKKYGGTKFTDLVHTARLEHACLQLQNTDMTIENIVNDVGYSNITFFYRIFKQYYGVTPSEFRKNARSVLLQGNKQLKP